ncbi:hypothetical protein ACTFIY_000411 [Dictyostelium cf. discoideum]
MLGDSGYVSDEYSDFFISPHKGASSEISDYDLVFDSIICAKRQIVENLFGRGKTALSIFKQNFRGDIEFSNNNNKMASSNSFINYLKSIGLDSYESLLVNNGFTDEKSISQLSDIGQLLNIGVNKEDATNAIMKVFEKTQIENKRLKDQDILTKIENKRLKEQNNVYKKTHLKSPKDIQPNSHSSYYYSKQNLVNLEVDFKDWKIEEIISRNDKIINRLIKTFKNANITGEISFQDSVSDDFTKLISNDTFKLVDSRRTKFVDCYPDWILYEKKFSIKPFFAHMVGESKLDEHLISHASFGQVMRYLDLLNIESKGRNELFGFIISNKRIIFIKSDYIESVSSKVSITKPMGLGIGFIYLKSIVNYCKKRDFPEDIGDFIEYQFKEVDFVGSGVSSSIFKYGDNVIKHFKGLHYEDWENEVIILEILKGGKGIPQLLAKGKRWIATSPYGTLINADTSYSDFSKFVDIIEYCHSKKVIHQDIRASNMIITSDGPILIDFGFSSLEGKVGEYAGTLTTASDNILKKIASFSPFSVTKSDDLISLVRTIFITKCTITQCVISQSDRSDPNSFIKNWEKAIEITDLQHYPELIKFAQEIKEKTTTSPVKEILVRFSESVSINELTPTSTSLTAPSTTTSTTSSTAPSPSPSTTSTTTTTTTTTTSTASSITSSTAPSTTTTTTTAAAAPSTTTTTAAAPSSTAPLTTSTTSSTAPSTTSTTSSAVPSTTTSSTAPSTNPDSKTKRSLAIMDFKSHNKRSHNLFKDGLNFIKRESKKYFK